MSNQENNERELLDNAKRQLGEFFDTVQIIVTTHDSENNQTVVSDAGTGNLMARYGSLKQWVLQTEQSMRDAQRIPETGEEGGEDEN